MAVADPVLRPIPARPALTVDGRDQAPLAEALLSLAVTESAQGLVRCEATASNWGAVPGGVGFLYFDRALLDFGRELVVEMGAGDGAAEVFSGRITALEGRYPRERPPEILVLAEDRLQDLRMVRRSRTFEDVTDAEVMETIAREHGLTPEVEVPGPTHRVLAQLNQSDLAFLRERARAVDAELWVDGTALRARTRARRPSAEDELTLSYGQGLHDFSVSADLAHQRTSLAVGGWDPAAKEAIEEEVGSEAVTTELDGGTAGGETLEQALGRRAERVVHLAPRTGAEARALAEACYRRLARRFVSGQGTAQGDARLRVGRRLRLSGLGELFDGPYTVTETEHTFAPDEGFITRFRVERPGLGDGGGR